MNGQGARLGPLAALAAEFAAASDDAARDAVRARLDATFWNTVFAAVADTCRDPLGSRLELADDMLLLLDFGALPGTAAAGSRNFGALRRAATMSARGVHWVSDALATVWQDTLRHELVQNIRARLDAIAGDLKEWPELHLGLIRHRDRLVLAALGDTPQAQHALRLYSEIDERLEQFKRLERLHRESAFRTNDERKQWLAIKGYVDDRQEGIQPLLEPLLARARDTRTALGEIADDVASREADLRAAEVESRRVQEQILAAYGAGTGGEKLLALQRKLAGVVFRIEKTQARIVEAQARADALARDQEHPLAAEQLVSAAEAVFDSVGHLIELHTARRALEQQLYEEQAARAQVTASAMRAALQSELSNLRGLLRLASRVAHRAECAVATGEGIALEPADLDRAMEHLLEFDPRLFHNEHARRHGPPSLLLAPGIGQAVYDRERNRFVLPLYSTGGPLESLAAGAAQYRLELDSAEGGEMANEYRRQQRRTAKLRSNLKLRNRLAEDYVVWITREATGETALSREARAWFERFIAPDKESPRVPPEFLDLSPRQLTGKLAELERAAPSARREARCAVLYWLLYPGDERALRDWALPRIERALELDAADTGNLYSAAVMHRKAGNLRRAVELFDRFARVAPRSWWTRKAEELSATCR
ncbi:MAG: hypothetical protein HS108_15150 [Planctomycetes bacterium]|nr:hypothetical protein [Planctomycetota bacterium]